MLIVNKKNMYSQTSISVFSFMSLRSKLDSPAPADPQQTVSLPVRIALVHGFIVGYTECLALNG